MPGSMGSYPVHGIGVGVLPVRRYQRQRPSPRPAKPSCHTSEPSRGAGTTDTATPQQPALPAHLFSLYSRAASLLAGELGFGSDRRLCRQRAEAAYS